jgi:tetratricopeptide (TPR) repeat protein
MNLPLPRRRSRALLLALSCAFALLVGFLGIRNALAAHFLGLDTRDGYERAVKLEPRNPRNWYLLGRSYLYDLEQPDPEKALSALRKSVELDPYSAEAMLDLAIAYDSEGDPGRARQALEEAQRVYPLSADVSWSFGNFLLRRGDQNGAFAQFYKTLQLDPKRTAEAFSRALQLQPDVRTVLDRVVPPSPGTYLPILRMLSGAYQMEDAQLVWDRLVGLNRKVRLDDTVVFIDALISHWRTHEALKLWPEATAMMENPPPPDPAGSLIWDGGFESGLAGGGFRWRFTPVTRDVQISFDRSEKHSGEQSLRLLFNGHENVNFEDACHLFMAEPGKRYLLSGWIKTQSLTSSEGIRFQITAYTGKSVTVVLGGEIHGTQPWTQITLPWTSPEEGALGKLCLRRKMSDMPGSDIQGAAWLDDVSLVPADNPTDAGGKP